jgi:hypothetical protein
VRYGTGKAVKLPDNDNLEFSFVGVGNQAVQLRAAFFGTGDASVYVFADERPAAALAIFSYFSGLNFRVLPVI